MSSFKERWLLKSPNDIRLIKPHFKVIFDQQGSIGKRYYRQDEAGTPFGITVDHQSLEDDTITFVIEIKTE